MLPPELLSKSDDDTRGREIVTLMQPINRVDLQGQEVLPVLGVPQDGEEDEILLLVQIDRMYETQDPSTFTIHFTIEGEELDETLKPQEKFDDFS